MTFTTQELRTQHGVNEVILRWRQWRRGKRLSVAAVAALVQLNPWTITYIELGHTRKPLPSTLAKLTALMASWDESMRPVRVDRRGGRRRKGERVTP